MACNLRYLVAASCKTHGADQRHFFNTYDYAKKYAEDIKKAWEHCVSTLILKEEVVDDNEKVLSARIIETV